MDLRTVREFNRSPGRSTVEIREWRVDFKFSSGHTSYTDRIGSIFLNSISVKWMQVVLEHQQLMDCKFLLPELIFVFELLKIFFEDYLKDYPI